MGTVSVQQKEPSLFILSVLLSFASVSAVLPTPALPEVAQKLNISPAQAQLTMTLFLVGYALGMLPWGPLSNRFGRKSAIYLGTGLALIGSLVVVWAGAQESLCLFVLGRFLSALGASVGLKISLTMIGDVYSQHMVTKKLSIAMLSFAIAPGLATVLGGFLTDSFGWRSCFYFLTGYSLFILLLSSLLPETHRELMRDALNLKIIKSAYQRQLRHKKLILSALIMGCGSAVVYLFATLAPFLGINHIGLTAQCYGLLNFIPYSGMIIGYILSHQLAGKKEPLSVILFGILVCSAVSVTMLLLFCLDLITIWTLFFPMLLLDVGLALFFAHASGFSISHAQDKSTASSMISFINVAVSIIALVIAEMLPPSWLCALPVLFSLICAILLILEKRLRLAMQHE
jgi:MFS transporter, DHA1 family, multidrug resistance protein